MPRNYLLRILTVLFTLAMTLSSRAQVLTLTDLLVSDQLPTLLSLKDLSPSYKAVRITTSSGPADAMSSLMPLMMMSSPENRDKSNDLVSMVGTYWTTGKTVNVANQNYLVGYKLDLSINAKPTGSGSPLGVALKLSLIRSDAILVITPEPLITPERLAAALISSEYSFNDASSIRIEGTTAETAAILAPVFSQAKLAATKTQALSNVKQISIALIVYASDYDDVFPYVQSTGGAIKATEPYSKTVKTWWSPSGSRFLFNSALAGVSQVTLEDPSKTVLVYTETPWPDGSREVGYADGHAKRVQANEWEKLKQDLTKKWKKTAKKPLPLDYGKEYNQQTPPQEK